MMSTTFYIFLVKFSIFLYDKTIEFNVQNICFWRRLNRIKMKIIIFTRFN